MGYGSFDTSAYDAAKAFRKASGTPDFGYNASMSAMPHHSRRVAPELDPKGATREARDSAEHPESVPIIVLFDVTGSMRRVPQVMQTKLGQLFGLLQRKGYVAHPQIMFGAIGDADTDRAPLQVGQFESDNRMDEQLRTIYLEGGGGGQQEESYELAAYFIARHTVTDAWDRRGRRGYCFIIGDEMNKKRVSARRVAEVIGDDIGEDLSVKGIWSEVFEKWDTYYVLPNQSSYFDDPKIEEHWKGIFGQNFLRLDDPAAVCELIALTIGLGEDNIDLDEGLDDLKEIGSAAGSSVSKALATVGAGRGRAVASRLPDGLDTGDDIA